MIGAPWWSYYSGGFWLARIIVVENSGTPVPAKCPSSAGQLPTRRQLISELCVRCFSGCEFGSGGWILPKMFAHLFGGHAVGEIDAPLRRLAPREQAPVFQLVEGAAQLVNGERVGLVLPVVEQCPPGIMEMALL